MASKRTVLITGCSQGGLGEALAIEFHRRGLRVFATARNESKMGHLKSMGIETLVLDVVSADSIKQCVSQVSSLTGGSLDILINNSGGGYNMPLVDLPLDVGRKVFEVNVWAVLGVSQAFLPLLLRSTRSPMIANHTSIASVSPIPTQGIYGASKAATMMLTDTLRLELQAFGIKVVELKSGTVKSNFHANRAAQFSDERTMTLPPNSIYGVARDALEKFMNSDAGQSSEIPADVWARQVVGDLLAASPPVQVWRGGRALPVWFIRRFFPRNILDGLAMKMSGMSQVVEAVKAQKKIA